MERIVLPLACLVWLVVVPGSAGAQENLLSRHAEAILAALHEDPPLPPPLSTAGERVTLPDRPGQRLAGTHGVMWYRWRFGRVRNQKLYGLYLPQACSNAVAYLNGSWLGQGGRFLEPTAHTWYRPLYFRFSGDRLDHEQNVLVVGLLLNGGIFDALSPVALGLDSALLPRYERTFALRIPPAEASTILSLAILFLFGGLALALRESTYTTLAVASGCYAVASLNYHCLAPPVSTWCFNTITNLCLQWAGLALALLGFLWANPYRPTVIRATLALAALCGFAALCLDPPVFEQVMFVGYLAVAAMAVGGFQAIWRARHNIPANEWFTYFSTACLLVPIALRDIWVQLGHQRAESTFDDVFLFAYFGPIMLIGAGAALLLRFVRVYRRAQHANRELEQEVQRKSAELTRQFENIREIETRKVLMEERERMMREMHDGVGGHLVAAISLIERSQPSEPELLRVVRDALDDVRLVLHALEPQSGDISLLLADLRRQLEPRLRAQGLRFSWEVGAHAAPNRLGPSDVLQVLRILQEAITNALKHASASVIRVSSGLSSEGGRGYFVEICDDGRGFCEAAGSGRGLANMRQRAARIGAELSIATSREGTSVRLLFPERDAA